MNWSDFTSTYLSTIHRHLRAQLRELNSNDSGIQVSGGAGSRANKSPSGGNTCCRPAVVVLFVEKAVGEFTFNWSTSISYEDTRLVVRIVLKLSGIFRHCSKRVMIAYALTSGGKSRSAFTVVLPLHCGPTTSADLGYLKSQIFLRTWTFFLFLSYPTSLL